MDDDRLTRWGWGGCWGLGSVPVMTSERVCGGRHVGAEGWFGFGVVWAPFGVEAKSAARVTRERSVRASRVREGAGGKRSRVREACVAVIGAQGERSERSGATERPRGRGREAAREAREPERPRDGRCRRDEPVFRIKNSHFWK